MWWFGISFKEFGWHVPPWNDGMERMYFESLWSTVRPGCARVAVSFLRALVVLLWTKGFGVSTAQKSRRKWRCVMYDTWYRDRSINDGHMSFFLIIHKWGPPLCDVIRFDNYCNYFRIILLVSIIPDITSFLKTIILCMFLIFLGCHCHHHCSCAADILPLAGLETDVDRGTFPY